MRYFVVLCLVRVLAAQDGVLWNDLRSKNPSGMEFHLRLMESRDYRRGELVPVELKLPSWAPGQVPPNEPWQSAGFLLDPPADCGSVAKPCVMRAPQLGGLMAGKVPGQPEILALNSYLPPLSPGRYRVAALARKMDSLQYVVSEAIEFRVVAATAEWVQQAIAKSVATLQRQTNGYDGYQARTEAAQQLGFLDAPAAWTASVDLLPHEEGTLLRGLSTTATPASVCELMQARVPAPTQSVSTSYLYTMTEICARANLPPAPVPSGGMRPVVVRAVLSTAPPPVAVAVAPPNPEPQAYFEKRRAYTEGVMTSAAAALAASLVNKDATVKSEAFATLLQRVQQTRANRPPEPDPAWVAVLRQEFVRAFPSMEVARKQYLLDMYAAVFDSPDSVPLLESVLDGWKPGDYYEAAHSALRALYNADPARAQARILAELTKAQTWLDPLSLELLPASAVPPMDDALIEALARAQSPGGWNSQLSMAAIAKYATPRALARIKMIYESQQQRCQPELMAYFVRVDPAYAEHAFHSHTWDMHIPPPSCTLQYFQRTAQLAMSPALEQYMAAYLMHGDVHVKTTAAHTLGRYGSSAALPKLWDTFRYFHEYWKGKAAELEKNGEGVGLELELRDAIARGRGWLATDNDLRLIQSLCSASRCLSETEQDLRAWDQPLRIQITDQTYGVRGQIAQYDALDGPAAIESKLAQFPKALAIRVAHVRAACREARRTGSEVR